MAEFKPALERLWSLEGGYVNDAADHGGATRFGITQAVAREHGYDGDMRELPQDLAADIYRTDYWAPLKLDLFPDQALANVMFDFSVNAGVGTAAKALQRCVGVPDDGDVGPFTLARLSWQGWAPGQLLARFKDERILYYREIAENHPDQARFLAGWINRAEKPALLPEVAA